MISRLFPLALVMLTACQAAPEKHEVVPSATEPCVLIGTWERRVPFEEGAKVRLPAGSSRARELLDWTETFHADGRWTAVVEGSLVCGNASRSYSVRDDGVAFSWISSPAEVHGEWQVLSADPQRIELNIRCRAEDHHEWTATEVAREIGEQQWVFAVNSPDELTMQTPSRVFHMVRVKDAK